MLTLLRQGQATSYLIEDAPEPFRSEQISIGVKSTYLVPISVEGQWWGVLDLDDCHEAKLRSIGTPRPLPPEVETNLLRIGQEALTNAIRHAHAQTMHLDLRFTATAVQLQIVDNGQGFDPQALKQGFGLVGMQERSQRLGGQFTLKSSSGQGTELTVSVPI